MYRLRIATTRKRRCYAPLGRGNRHHITRVDFHRRTLHDDRYGEYEPEHSLLPDQDAFRSFQRSANDAHTSSGGEEWMRFNTVAVFQASSNGGEVRFRYEGRMSTKADEPDNSGDLNGPGAIAKRDLYENVAAKKRQFQPLFPILPAADRGVKRQIMRDRTFGQLRGYALLMICSRIHREPVRLLDRTTNSSGTIFSCIRAFIGGSKIPGRWWRDHRIVAEPGSAAAVNGACLLSDQHTNNVSATSAAAIRPPVATKDTLGKCK